MFSKFNETGLQVEFADEIGIDRETMDYLVNLAELCRVQWVSPITGRMLIDAGYECCQKLASADADELYEAMNRVNENGKFFKGTIGLRDIKRLIRAARYFI